MYFVAPSGAKNAVLLFFSLIFYFWGEQAYIVIMLLQITAAYFSALAIEKLRGKRAKLIMIISVGACISSLLFFKYTDFFIESVGALGLPISPLGLALPMGISFFTFQTVSYIVDVYRGDVCAQKNFFSFACYVSMFPQLVAGPIVRYGDIEKSLCHRTFSAEAIYGGAFRFAVGLLKKVIIADRLYEFCRAYLSSNDTSVVFAWAYAAAFLLYVYFDFSGYSDMAIGLGKMFGFDFPENFDYPLISGSVSEFWRRWHITLGSWFRDYVYIPLGGNRRGAARHIFNLAVVWLLTGLWHGAAVTFVLWGAYFGALVIIEKLFFLRVLKRAPRPIRHVYLVVAAVVGFVFFGAGSAGEALGTISQMFGSAPLISRETGYYIQSYGLVLSLAALGATKLPKTLFSKIAKRVHGAVPVLKAALLAAVVVVSTAYFVDGSFSPFLYFRF